jgi:hypothetical protein
VRPDKSQKRRIAASGPGLSMVAVQSAGETDDAVSVLVRRAARLGVALEGLARELAAARREIAVLRRENTALRSKLDVIDAT